MYYKGKVVSDYLSLNLIKTIKRIVLTFIIKICLTKRPILVCDILQSLNDTFTQFVLQYYYTVGGV